MVESLATPAPVTTPGTTNGYHIVADAVAQIGQPFKYGGNHPNAGGFDSQGLAQYAYGANGIPISGPIYEQVRHGDPVALRDLQPGDLVFMGTSPDARFPDTTGIYAGDGTVVTATPGKGVHINRISMVGKPSGAIHMSSVVKAPTPKQAPVAAGSQPITMRASIGH
jgi:cell wall-associated NlpC family hydrolase